MLPYKLMLKNWAIPRCVPSAIYSRTAIIECRSESSSRAWLTREYHDDAHGQIDEPAVRYESASCVVRNPSKDATSAGGRAQDVQDIGEVHRAFNGGFVS